MYTIAEVKDGVIIRTFQSETPPPAHKQNVLKVIEYPERTVSLDLEFVETVGYRAEGENKLVAVYKTVRYTIEVQKQVVKAEARRRILLLFPEWKQANMTARGVELQDVWRRNGKWTDEEIAEAAKLQAAWDTIKRIRVNSDALEALDPIPADFRDDKYWS